MDKALLSTVRTRYGSFTASQKKVADFVLDHPDKVMISSMNDLAVSCDVSEPTIMRFLHKLDYESYQIFRVNLAQELGSGTKENVYNSDITFSDNTEAVIKKVLATTSQSLNDVKDLIDPEKLEHAVVRILSANVILVIGVGSSAAQAMDLTHKLQRLGMHAFSCNDPHMINIMSNNLTSNDLLFAFSHSGESREILDGAKIAQRNNTPVVSVTSFPNASIVSHSNEVILSSSYETGFRSDALTSRIIQMTIIDMIYVCLTLKLGKVAEERINSNRLAVAHNKT